MRKKLIYVLMTFLAAAVVGYLAYELLVQKTVNPEHIFTALAVLFGFASALLGGKRRRRRSAASRRALYKKAYADLIGEAFAGEPKGEKLLYSALEDLNQENYDRALKKLGELKAYCRRSGDHFTVSFFTGRCLQMTGSYREAVERYAYAMQIRENYKAAVNLGRCYDLLGETENAVSWYRRAMVIDPKDPLAPNDLAQIYMKLGEYETSLDYAQQANALDASLVPSLNAQAVCYAMLGQQENYEKFYRMAVANGSDGKRLKAYIQSLDPVLR